MSVLSVSSMGPPLLLSLPFLFFFFFFPYAYIQISHMSCKTCSAMWMLGLVVGFSSWNSQDAMIKDFHFLAGRRSRFKTVHTLWWMILSSLYLISEKEIVISFSLSCMQHCKHLSYNVGQVEIVRQLTRFSFYFGECQPFQCEIEGLVTWLPFWQRCNWRTKWLRD